MGSGCLGGWIQDWVAFCSIYRVLGSSGYGWRCDVFRRRRRFGRLSFLGIYGGVQSYLVLTYILSARPAHQYDLKEDFSDVQWVKGFVETCKREWRYHPHPNPS